MARQTAWHTICGRSGTPSTCLGVDDIRLVRSEDVNNKHTRTIVDINVVGEIFSIVLRRRSDIAAERGASKTGCCVRNVPRALESFISRVQENTLLRIHASGLPWRDPEKLVVEIGEIVHEIACFDPRLAIRRPNIVRGIQRKFETIVRNLDGYISHPKVRISHANL